VLAEVVFSDGVGRVGLERGQRNDDGGHHHRVLDVGVEAIQGSPELTDANSVSTSTFPFNSSLSATAGNSTNVTGYDFDAGTSSAFFHTTFDHARDGSGGSSVLSSGSTVFTANGSATYTISGGYNLSGYRGIELSVLLVDVTDSFNEVSLFENAQTSVAAMNQAFTVGGTAGDDFNLLTGTLTGSLVAGNDYMFLYDFTILSDLPPDQTGDPAASAVGFLNLDIALSDVTTNIPAPGGVALAMVGFGFTGWLRRRRD